MLRRALALKSLFAPSFSSVLGSLCILGSLASLSACDPSWFIGPQNHFKDSITPVAPDYQRPQFWAASPDKLSKARLTPPGEAVAESPDADVFFVHPTTWFDRKQWNARFEAGVAQEIVDEISMGTQASVFNACCRIFAPRYRQAMLGAFYAEPAEAQAAFEMAYGDVERAFEVFLNENPERPFVIAGHSQGSMHAMRLLETRIQKDPELLGRLVVAYLPGVAIPEEWYLRHQMPACKEPSETGCIAAWDTYRAGAEVRGHEPVYHWYGQQLLRVDAKKTRQCTNPITWHTAARASSPGDHLGAVAGINTGAHFSFSQLLFAQAPLGIKITGLSAPQPLVTASCDQALRVPDLNALDYPVLETQPGNYHLLDYELFWQDIRENVALRLAAWKAS